jgi:hypothetical protein
MPTYDYRCETTGQIYEVRHSISTDISNWAELCDIGSLDPENIPGDTPVKKVIRTTGGVVDSAALKNPEAPPCVSGGGCPGGSCGI